MAAGQFGGRLQDRLAGRDEIDRAGEGGLRETAIARGRFDVIIDVVAGPDLPSFLDRLDPNGRMVAVGVLGGHEVLPLEKAELAHRKMDAGEVFGRIVLAP